MKNIWLNISLFVSLALIFCEVINGEETQKLCEIRKYVKNHNDMLLQISDLLQQNVISYDMKDDEECPVYHRKDCADILKVEGIKENGAYATYPDGKNQVPVYCDMTTAGGGWTVFQRRQDGSVNFNQTWDAYKHGFGALEGEFWLGNDNLAKLTPQRVYKLRVDLTDFDDEKAYAEYNEFLVLPEDRKYRLVFSAFHGYNGTAGDSLWAHGGNAFSTYDQDNDITDVEHCAQHTGAGFWFYSCQMVGLNGPYSNKPNVYPGQGITWRDWHGAEVSLKRTEMKFRPMDF